MIPSHISRGAMAPRSVKLCPARMMEPLRMSTVSKADSESGLSAMHDALLKEIEDRRKRQNDLLAKLNSMSMQTVAQPPPKPVAPPQAAPSAAPTRAPAPTAAGKPYASWAPAPPTRAPVLQRKAPQPYIEPDTPRPNPIIDMPEPPLNQEGAEPLAGPNVMNIVMVGSECGLGDVVSALPKALRRRGHRMMVVAPRYGEYQEAFDTGVRLDINLFGGQHEVGYFHAFIDEVDYIFIDHPSFHGREKNIYSGSRSDLQFRTALLSKAAIEAVWHVPCGGVPYGDSNLAFIANDWHTAMLPVYLQAHYRDYGQMTYARCLFIIHNMAHQGRGPFEEVHNYELNDHYKSLFFVDDPVGGEHMNILKAGLECSHRLVAVSRGYSWECRTVEGGMGLHDVLNKDDWKLSGIVNGMDYSEWSPTDGYANYNADSLSDGKAKCKAALQRELGLPENPDAPLFGFIGRLDYQKGVDLITESYEWITEQGAQIIFLGSGREDLEGSLRHMENSKRDQIRSWVGFSVKMAHRITAGCDILLMPSRFEPCGLNQLYAMAYGTVPVVHAVGGLRDTVQPHNPDDNSGTGWTFDQANVVIIIHTVKMKTQL
eukprot:gene2721-12594_t